MATPDPAALRLAGPIDDVILRIERAQTVEHVDIVLQQRRSVSADSRTCAHVDKEAVG